MVYGVPADREGAGVAEIEAAIDTPALRDRKRFDHMGICPVWVWRVAPLGKHLTAERIPVTV